MSALFRSLAVTGIIISLLGVSSCRNSGEEPERTGNKPFDKIELTASQVNVVTAGNSFAYRLLARSMEGNENVIQSPLSVATALSMLANGAVGETRDGLLSVIGSNDMESLNSCYSTLIGRLPEADDRVDFNIANSLWLDTDLPVKKDYSSILSDVFSAAAFNDNLATVQAKDRINKWCEDATHGMIPKLLEDPLDGKVALINAVYFKGQWTTPFNKEKTTAMPFHNDNGSTVEVPMMYGPNNYLEYAADENAEAVRLTYGNGAFFMEIVIPMPDKTCQDVLQTYASQNEKSLDFNYQCVNVTMPKFTVESKFDLVKTLIQLGAHKAFGSDSDFSLISERSPEFNFVLHKALIEVDEEGSKAAASTVIGGLTSTGVIPVEMKLDRPFLFFIKERSTDAIVFSGIIRNL